MKVLRLSLEGSLFDAHGNEFVDQILILAEQIHRGEAQNIDSVFIFQVNDNAERLGGWIQNLDTRIMLHNLAARIEKFRWVLSLIRKSPIPWVYLSRSTCFGSYWELASACDIRMWFSRSAHVGFPEIWCGSFPPGGTLENIFKTSSRVRDSWHLNPVRSTSDAFEDGIIDFLSEVDEFELSALDICKEVIKNHSAFSKRTVHRKSEIKRYDFERDLKARNESLNSLFDAWRSRDISHDISRIQQSWEYCWYVVQNKNMFANSHERGRVIAYICAHYYLSREFKFSMANFMLNRIQHNGRHPFVFDVLSIHIDVNLMAPPAEAVRRILDLGLSIIFFAQTAEKLASSLHIIFGKGEMFGSDWLEKVSWFHGKVIPDNKIVFRWSSKNKLIVLDKQIRLELLSIEKKQKDQKLNFLEWINPGDNLEQTFAFQIISLISDGVLRSKKITNVQLPLSIYIKSNVFEELCKFCAFSGLEMDRVLEALKHYGWGVISDPNMWEDFLQERADNFQFERGLKDAFGNSLTKSIWEASSLKSARLVTKKLGVESKFISASRAHISQHFAVYISMLTLKLAPLFGGTENSELICSIILGFSSKYGTPLSYLRHYGRRRIAAYTNRIWPEIDSHTIGRDGD